MISSLVYLDHRVSSPEVALIIATIPARISTGNSGQAAKSESSSFATTTQLRVAPLISRLGAARNSAEQNRTWANRTGHAMQRPPVKVVHSDLRRVELDGNWIRDLSAPSCLGGPVVGR